MNARTQGIPGGNAAARDGLPAGRPLRGALLFLLLSAPALGQETVFLTEEEALRVVFPDFERTFARDLELPAEARRAAEARTGRPIPERLRLYVGMKEGRPARYAVITEEIGKYLPITFIVAVGADGRVAEVAVMVHREHIGTECAKRRYTQQLLGKSVESPCRRNRDLISIEGATLSCDAVARGTRMVLAIVQELLIARPGYARALSAQDDAVAQQRMRMGTLCTVTARGPKAREGIRAAFDEIARIERILSDYDPDSELSKLNASGATEAAGDELMEFLERSIEHSRASGGAFDVTVGSLVDLWGFRTKAYRVPDEAELARAAVGFEGISIEGRAVRLRAGLRLDPGAIGKGLALDRAAAALREAGVTDALLDFGSTALAIGDAPDAEGWPLAIRDPYDAEEVMATVRLKDEALAVSGNYEKFFEADGKVYGHILDPRTRRPVEPTAATAVIARTATEADALSTAIFVLGGEEGLKLARARGVEAHVAPADSARPALCTAGWGAKGGTK